MTGTYRTYPDLVSSTPHIFLFLFKSFCLVADFFEYFVKVFVKLMPGAVRSIARGLREVSGVALALWLASVSPNPSRSRLELLVNLCLSKARNPWWALYAVCTVRMPTSEWVFAPFLFRSFFRHNFDDSLLVLRPEARPSRVKAGTERELINDPRRLLTFCSTLKLWTRLWQMAERLLLGICIWATMSFYHI